MRRVFSRVFCPYRPAMARRMRYVFAIVFILSGAVARAQYDPPAGYYAAAAGLTGPALKAVLHDIIDDHQRFSYDACWGILELADEDPDTTTNIRDIYKNAQYLKTDRVSWNREHLWPKSYGFPNDGSTNYPYTDCHHLRASDASYNSSRGNKPFDWCLTGCTERPVDGFPLTSNWTSGTGSTGTWEMWLHRRGDVARALFYMDVRYEGGTHGVTGAAEPDLILTNNRDLIVSSTSNQTEAYMGVLSTLIQWHLEDPVDERERRRNHSVYSYQGNRNPFVDNPDWVCAIWTCTAPTPTPTASPTPVPPPNPWINEIHYDNAGADEDEGVEIAGIAGLDLAGWRVYGYNGDGGAFYSFISLSGVLPDQQSGYGTLWFAYAGLQNGALDGLALVNPAGEVIQFLSYEGTFTATSGPALGMTSVDIGVSQEPAPAIGLTLQLRGTGCAYADYTWEGPVAQTRGFVNVNQILNCATPTPTSTATSTATPTASPTPTPSLTPSPTPTPAPPWINEIHYDNEGADVDEGVEIAGPTGTNLTGWKLIGYNGAGGAQYKTVNLSGILPDQQNGLGTLWFNFVDLQNGAPDGIALVNASNQVVWFLSYEGVFTATDSPATGMTSVDIGVKQDPAPAVGLTLQLTGTGWRYEDFTWTAPAAHTRGEINVGQTLAPAEPVPVDLAGFDAVATAVGASVRLRWETAAEYDNIGFHVYRAVRLAQGGYYAVRERLTTQLIPAKGVAGGGARYEFFDPVVLSDPEESRAYFLEDIDASGLTILNGPYEMRYEPSAASPAAWCVF